MSKFILPGILIALVILTAVLLLLLSPWKNKGVTSVLPTKIDIKTQNSLNNKEIILNESETIDLLYETKVIDNEQVIDIDSNSRKARSDTFTFVFSESDTKPYSKAGGEFFNVFGDYAFSYYVTSINQEYRFVYHFNSSYFDKLPAGDVGTSIKNLIIRSLLSTGYRNQNLIGPSGNDWRILQTELPVLSEKYGFINVKGI